MSENAKTVSLQHPSAKLNPQMKLVHTKSPNHTKQCKKNIWKTTKSLPSKLTQRCSRKSKVIEMVDIMYAYPFSLISPSESHSVWNVSWDIRLGGVQLAAEAWDILFVVWCLMYLHKKSCLTLRSWHECMHTSTPELKKVQPPALHQ